MARFLRRHALIIIIVGMGTAPLPSGLMMSASGQPTATSRRVPVNLMKPKTRDAVNRGLAFLAARQNEDGSFGVCVICEDLIPEERMMEVPNATKCVDCKETEKLNI